VEEEEGSEADTITATRKDERLKEQWKGNHR